IRRLVSVWIEEEPGRKRDDCRKTQTRSAELSLSFPTAQNLANISLNYCARRLPVVTSRQQSVVIRFQMPNVRYHRQPHNIFSQALRRSRPADAAAVFPACVFGYRGLSFGWASGEEFSYALRELLHVLPIQLLSPNGFALLAPLPDLAVGQAFIFGLFK